MVAELQVQLLKEASHKRGRLELSIKGAVIIAGGILIVAALVRIFA
jgi:hypothetical protein